MKVRKYPFHKIHALKSADKITIDLFQRLIIQGGKGPTFNIEDPLDFISRTIKTALNLGNYTQRHHGIMVERAMLLWAGLLQDYKENTVDPESTSQYVTYFNKMAEAVLRS